MPTENSATSNAKIAVVTGGSRGWRAGWQRGQESVRLAGGVENVAERLRQRLGRFSFERPWRCGGDTSCGDSKPICTMT
jgi:hypothetical protein